MKYDASRTTEAKLLRASKDRARLQKIPHNITIEDIKVPDNCPICGVLIAPVPGSRGGSSSSPSLDKVVPSKGYIKGNVQVLCKKCNSMKGDSNADLLRKMIEYIDKNTL